MDFTIAIALYFNIEERELRPSLDKTEWNNYGCRSTGLTGGHEGLGRC